jgi:2-polyprenyl-3-methyl-5-hydroxy-6-metoxy-1,4-benzoquinol methylase
MNPVQNSTVPVPVCHVCGSRALVVLVAYQDFHRVTSDCKPWPPGGKLGVCDNCGCAQAVLDQTWHDEAKQIYEAYAIYHQSKGIEQRVFDQVSGAAVSRSARLLGRFRSEISLPPTGRLMDVGCGNGALLRAFSDLIGGWSLVGVEVNDHYRSVVEAIGGVEHLFTCPPEAVPGRFQLISLMHALEHIPSPREFIGRFWDKLEPGGLLLVQVPDCAQNPFMFPVADHALHFFLATLRELVESAGFEVLVAANDWVAKEITVVARRQGERRVVRPPRAPGYFVPAVRARLDWLREQVRAVRSMAARGPVGIFGSSIAATWLFAELDGAVAYFMDEDPHRIGQMCCGRPILQSTDAPGDSSVFLALPPRLASEVKARLERLAVKPILEIPKPLPPE